MSFPKFVDSVKRFLTHYLDMSQDREEEAASVEAIRAGVEFKGSTILILVFAIFIASLGLNTNSAAVIIGAMLISPLMGPIMGIGLGLGINDYELIKRSFRNLAVATLFSVITSTIYFWVSPLNEARSELLARTSPTIYNVLIAFFGAFYLFFINSVFIAFATTLGVKLMKYSKKEFVDDERRKKVERMVYTILILTMAPSIYLTYNMVKENFFEVAASRFVSQNFNYADTQVLSKSAVTEHGKHIIRVSLVGAEIPKDSIAVAQARLPQYGLGGAILEVRQGYGQNQADISTLSSAMFKDIYLHNQEQIDRQQKTIDSLENLASHYQQYDSVGVEIAPEIKVLFPNVTDIAISKTIFSRIDTEARDTTTLAVVRHSKVFSLSEQKRFKEWLQARLGTKKVQLVIEK